MLVYTNDNEGDKESYGRARGAAMSGHNAKNPDEGLLRQLLDPPPQSAIPELPTRDAPIMRMTVPMLSC